MQTQVSTIFNALIRTHHITSRKKVAKLRKAAHAYADFIVIRSGGSPGLMYVEGTDEGVREWVTSVQRLRYKDYQLLCRPAVVDRKADDIHTTGFLEVETVPNFAAVLEKRGVLRWWRSAMGYVD